MNLKEIISKGAAFLEQRDAKHEEVRKSAGIILAQEAWERNARRQEIRARHDAAVAGIVGRSMVISDCCGSACLQNYEGEIICGECLDVCRKVSVK